MPSHTHQRSAAPATVSQGAEPARTTSAQARFGNAFVAEQLARKAPQGPAPAPDSAVTGTILAPDPAQTAGGATQTNAAATEEAVAPAAATTNASAAWADGTPMKVANPKPVQAGEQRRRVAGVEILGRDVSPSALDACERFVTASLGNRPDIQARMAEAKVALVILPRNRAMTDVPEFAGLKDQKTFDGRPWAEVRGSGGRETPGGLWAIAVPEENLVETGGNEDKYAPGYSVGLHELAHSIQSKGLDAADQKAVLALYEARKAAGGPWTEAYGASNDREYFAQATNCYFGANASIGENGPAWLRDNDPPLFAFLVKLYGPSPAGHV